MPRMDLRGLPSLARPRHDGIVAPPMLDVPINGKTLRSGSPIKLTHARVEIPSRIRPTRA